EHGLAETEHARQSEQQIEAETEHRIDPDQTGDEDQAPVQRGGQQHPQHGQAEQDEHVAAHSRAEKSGGPHCRRPISPCGRSSRIRVMAAKNGRPGSPGNTHWPSASINPSRMEPKNAPLMLPMPPTMITPKA